MATMDKFKTSVLQLAPR